MNSPRYRVIRRRQKTKAIAPYRWIQSQASLWRTFISDRHPLWWLWNYGGFAGGLYLFYLWVIYFPGIFLSFVGILFGIGSVCALISLLQRLNEND
jgi:hypothetical protein